MVSIFGSILILIALEITGVPVSTQVFSLVDRDVAPTLISQYLLERLNPLSSMLQIFFKRDRTEAAELERSFSVGISSSTKYRTSLLLSFRVISLCSESGSPGMLGFFIARRTVRGV